MSDCLILVPARYNSSRFPGKPLALINGMPMVHYVAKNCESSGLDYAVVTDDERIEESLKDANYPVVRVNENVSTGSERIALAYQKHFTQKQYKYIINVQGDEPLLTGTEILKLAKFHESNNHFDITTMIKKRNRSEAEFNEPNIVKCVFDEPSHKALYFSRAPVPYGRDKSEAHWFQHIGVYCYKVQALLKFVELKEHSIEVTEGLEQLRALGNGLSIGAQLTDINLIGIDSPGDLKKIEGAISGKEK